MSAPTAAQVRSYGVAAGAACRRLGIAGADACRDYRRRVVREETGRGSLGELRTAGEYDAVMARLWSDAGDAERAVHYGVGAERRLARTVRVLAAQLMQLKGGGEGGAAAYVDGVLARAGVPAGSHWMDLAPTRLAQLVGILDTERRRILRRSGARRLAFSDRVRYEVDGPVLVVYGVERGYYDGAGGAQ